MSKQHDPGAAYIERLTEAQLEGRALPAPSTDEEAALYAQFQETDSLFEEFRSMRLGNDWMKDVWTRIESDGAAAQSHDDDAASAEPARVAAPQVEAGSPAPTTDDADEGEPASGGAVIDAHSRFRLWPVLGGLAVAAVALFALAIPAMKASDGEARREADVMARADQQEAVAYEPAVVAEDQPAMPEGATIAQAARAAAPPSGALGGSGGESLADGIAATEPPIDANFELAEAAPVAPVMVTPDAPEREPTAGIDELRGIATKRKDEKTAKPASTTTLHADGERERGAATGRGGGWKGDGKVPDDDKDSRSGWNRPPVERVKLTAGDVDDNRNFDDFRRFLDERSKPHLEPMDVSERMFVRVLDRNNRPLANATVDFQVGGRTLFQATTYSDGWVLFHPRTVPEGAQAEGFDLVIRSGQASHNYRIVRGTKEQWQVRLPIERSVGPRQKLDLVFLLDTTQSMQDQIDTLQATIRDIAAEVAALPGEPEVRFGLVVFRDDTDEYVSRVFDFGSDVAAFQRLLAEQEAAGGGDLPERLEVGLHRTIHELSWAPDSTRMVFLIGDAGPHKRSLNEFSYSQDIQAAVSKGIKVFTVATSGLDDDGEYVFRQLAQFTMARFVFLTSGPSGTSTPHAVKPGSFQPETLDRLIVRLVREELAGLELETKP